MTDSQAQSTDPISHAVDLTGSYAQRIDGQVRVVLQLEGPGDRLPGPEPVAVRLTAGSRVVEAPVAFTERDGAPLVEVRLETSSLRGATWRLELVDGHRSSRLEARLVVAARRPVALLPGPEPTTVLAPPKPRRVKPVEPPAPGRLRGTLAPLANAALAQLPPQRAARGVTQS